ncbi:MULTISPECIES: alanyl-tRNA editing protein [unclassified Haladaptatus]|uniref:alanyl-tRNA editing protein n=1 Tax=unclassified Haladaptatus TaxID=2622732 RepID=UPI0023E87B29|nr:MULTISPECIES: alanyl-tRNA editing protein [unclassified Haladaptatus]
MDSIPRYLTDTDARSFESTVTRVADDRVVLSETLFYPEGGGQPADHGTLRADDAEWAVSDVQKKDTIYHTLGAEPPAEGTTITGELDWERRYAHMRYHTAQHLLSALLIEEYDAPTTGNQLYTDYARMDVEHDRFTDTDLADIEARMNDLVDESLPVTWYEMDREQAEAELDPVRTRINLLPKSIERLRIVEIEGYDRTACAGTHVANTDEIGTVEIQGRESRGKGFERVRFVLDE